MESIHIEQTLRPNKILIIIPKGNKQSLLKAIEINTLFWGGRFNPIIEFNQKNIIIKRFNKTHKYTPKEIVEGYLSAFDPDFILPLDLQDKDLSSMDFGDRQVLSLNKGINSINFDDSKRHFSFGTTIYEILEHLYKIDLKFARTDGERESFIMPNNDNLFLASIFGYLSGYKYDPIDKIKIDKISARITKKNYLDYMKYPTINKLTRFDLGIYPNEVFWDNGVIFLMDSTKIDDIITFWNLRASTIDVLPVDINIPAPNEVIKTFIETFYYKLSYSEGFNEPSLVFSNNLKEELCDSFWQSLPNKLKEKINIQPQPILFKYKNISKYCVDTRFEDVCVSSNSSNLKIKIYKPEFCNEKSFGQYKFCNEIKISPQIVNNKIIAKVFPQAFNKNLLSGIMRNERRLTLSTINMFSNNTGYLDLPDSDTIFINWLKNQGWQAKTGSISKLIKRIISFFDNPYDLHILDDFSDAIMLNLLQSLGQKELSSEGVRAKINEFLKKNKMKGYRFKENADNVLFFLIERNIIQLGFKIQCPICQHKQWHSIEDTKYKMKCSICLSDFDLPTHNPKELEYAYKAIGPFACNQNESNGIYTPLLTMHFFNQLYDNKTTAVFNIEAQKDNKKIEFDLGLFIKERHFRFNSEQLTIFCECKTYKEFAKNDIERMFFLAKEFPNSIIVFATQNSELSKNEKRLINKFKKQQEKLKQKGKSYSNIVILTSNELILNDSHSYKQNWEKLTDKHKEYSQEHSFDNQINNLAVKTCNLYLNDEN